MWKEIWDLDGSFGGGKDVPVGYQNNLKKWINEINDRRIRLYHSTFTTGKWDPVTTTGSLKEISSTGIGPGKKESTEK